MASEKNLRDAADRCDILARRNLFEFLFVNARNGTTINADKVRMGIRSVPFVG